MNGKMIIKTVSLAVATFALHTAAMAAQTQWPEKPVTMVVPFPPGGPTDIVARLLAQQLTERLGQTVIVENKGGANATIGMQAVASAKPDGYTILYNTSSIALSPALYKSLSYDPKTAFDPVSSTANIPLVLLVNPKVPVKTVEEFKSYVQENGDKISYGSAGAGNITHLGAFLMSKGVGLNAQHVPYKGSAPAMIDLVGGQTQFMLNTLNDSLSFIRDGKVKALALASIERNNDVLPNVPTLSETVLKDFEIGAWQGVVVPKGTPVSVVQKLNKTIRDSLASDKMTQQLKGQGAEILGSSPEEYGAFIMAEMDRWKKAVEEAGVQSN